MNRSKKTPMYESTTMPNQTKTYQFLDYTTVSTEKESTSQNASPKDSHLIKKIQSIYRSQLLNIQESKQEENHGDDQLEEKKVISTPKRVFGELTNLVQPFSKILRLDTHQTLGTGEDLDDEGINTGRSSCQKQSSLNLHNDYYIQKQKTCYQYQQNFKPSYFKSLAGQYSSYKTNIYSLEREEKEYSQWGSGKKYQTNFSQFTSDDLIQIMPNPFRSNLQILKERVKNRIEKIR